MDLTAVFVAVDDFCQRLDEALHILSLEADNNDNQVRLRRRPCLTQSEIMTIIIWFQQSGYRTFKNYYCHFVSVYMRREFPCLPSYNRFVELMQRTLLPMVYLLISRFGTCTGISFIDSTKIAVCHNRRIKRHKVFKGLAQRGKTSVGWFFGFKVHVIVNDQGELLSVIITPGNVSDKDFSLVGKLTRTLRGKLVGDKGYISSRIFESLFQRGLQMITKIKKNMKNRPMALFDKLLLRKRAIIENVFDTLKNTCQMEHTRHRSVWGGFLNLISALVAYTFISNKPKVKLDDFQTYNVDSQQLLV